MSNSRVTAALEARKRRNEEASKTSKSNNGSTRNSGNNSTVNSTATNSKVEDALKARQVRIKNEIPNTLASIQKQYNSLVTNYNSASPSFGEGAYKDTVINQREARVQLSDLERKIDAYRSYMDEGTADSLLSNLSQMRSGYDAYVYMSRFKSQDEYKKSIMTVEEIDKAIANAEKALEMSYKTDINRAVKTNQNSFSPVPAQSSENTKSLENEIEELKAWRTVALQNDEARKNAELFETYRNDKDFQTNAASGLEAFNNSKLAENEESENRSWWEKTMINMGNAGKSEITLAMDAYRDDTSYREPQDNWTQEQKDMFGYLYNKDPNTAFEYATNVNNAISAEEANKQREKIRELATKSPIIHTIGSVAVSPLGLADYLDNLVEYAARGTITDKDYVTPYDYSQEVRGAISNDLNTKYGTLNEKIPVIGGKGLGDVYGLGTSIADSALSTYTGGSIGPLVTFFGSAAASAVDDAKQRGASDDQALVIGALAGLAEGLAEQIGAEKLLNIGSSHTMRELLLNLAKQGVSEGLEEGTTTLLNNFADQLVLQDKSNFNALVSYYVTEEHLSADEAKKKAWASMAEDLAYDMLGGFVSGAVHAGPQTAVQTIIGNAQAKSLYGESQQELVEQGLQSTPGSLSRTLAMQYQEKLENGGNLTGSQLSRLVEANEQQIRSEDIYNIQRAVQARLTELGETGDIASISYALARQVAGESLTSSDRKALKNSKYGEQVANELDKANINSGKYSAEWAQKIGTNRINADEYSRLVQDAQMEQESAGETEDTNVNVASDVPEITYASTDDAKQTTDMNAQSVTEMDMEEESNTKEDSKKTVTIEDVSKKYGAQAPAVMSTYQQGQDVEKFDAAYQIAYNMGKSGVSIRYAKNSDAVSFLTDKQIDIAYNTGKDAAAAEANVRDTQNKSATNGKTGRKKGVVRGEGVTISDLKQTFNDTQGKAYKYLSTVAEVTGIDIVLYRSDAGPDGKFQGAQGRYSRSEPGTIYIDLNAGLSDIKSADDLAKYAMLRTFAHEFTHFIEKWNPVQYNEFRKVVFNTLSERGENVNDLIEEKQARNPGMSYDKASREVVAEAMTDILPDANFVQELAENHKTIFQNLLDKLKEFVANLRDYFNSIGYNSSKEANALKEQVGETVKYLDSIVKLFDQVAVQAVENYQMTVAVEESSGDASIAEAKSETTAEETANVETITDDYGFTVTNNAEHGSLEISFEGKPSEQVRDVLKTNKFRWHRAKKVWYGYADRAEIVNALRAAYETEADDQTAEDQAGSFESTYTNASQEERNEVVDAIGNVSSAAAPTIVVENVESETTTVEEAKQELRNAVRMPIQVTNTPGNVAKVLDELKVKVNQEIIFDKQTVSMLKSAGRVITTEINGQKYVSNGAILLQVTDRGVEFAHKELEAKDVSLPKSTAEILESATELIKEAPTEAKFDTKPIYIFDIGAQKLYFDKKLLSFIDGGVLYHNAGKNGMPVIKSVNEDGSVKGYLIGLRVPDVSRISGEKPSKLRSFSKKKQEAISSAATNIKEEETQNGKESENGPDTGAVQQPVRSGEEASRLLEGVEPEAVQSGSEGRGSVRAGIDEGREDAGRDEQPDAAGPVSERSARDSVGGDLQQLSELNDKSDEGAVVENRAEALHEEVQQQIAKKSTTQPKGSNFVIGESLDLPNGTKARTRANIEAIKLVKQIAADGRAATAAEQEILSKYVGWGGLADAFGKPVSNRETRRIEYEAVRGLEAEFEELKRVLTEEEYKSARESTKNAHYTSIEVIKAMYDGLKHLGFTGGRMLEPSSGVGNFVGAMPADMSAQVKSWTMVELDNITGLFAKYLYPNADVRIQGFEETNIPDGYMDVAIGNVPFGKYPITDKHYPKIVTGAIHNYFFAKSLDKVRPGGIVMFITSAYTMNASDSAVRKYIMQRADLLGAIRLPNTAFSGNAGTSVVTDILILKKRAERTEYSGEAFETSSWERIGTTGYYDGAYVNEYFVKHPEMVLGIPKMSRGMYSSNELTYDPFTDRGSLGDQIREAMQNISGKMDYSTQLSAEKANFRQASAKKKSQRLQVKNGVIQQMDENGNLTKVEVDADTAARITGMVAIRDAHTALCDALQQGVNKKESNSLRKTLNNAYDSFVKKYGYLNSPKNKKAIKSFSDSYSILSLENYSTEGKKVSVTKADIFSKDTIAANRSAAMAENVEEGLTISLNTTGTVDVSMISRLTGEHVDSVTRQLIDQRLVFKDKDGNLIPAVQYLSGNVRAKLREMEGLTGIDRDYQNNVEALRAIVPPTVEYTDIYVNPGANWVPVSVYEDFVSHILSRRNSENYRTGKKDFSVEYVPETNEYKVSINDIYAKMSAQNTQVWGEGGKAFSTIFENMLNGRRTNVYMEGPDGKRVLDKVKTEAVAEKVEKLNEEFRKWLWSDEARRADMQELYNEAYNALVTPKYSGKNLTVNGLNSTYSLREHQADAVSRIINSGGNTLLAHRVGAGKTLEMAAAAMKLKQLGIIKKPMFVVPNNVVSQWGEEFKDYFPAANILLVGDDDMTPAERMTTINKIKNNDYDAVILAYTKFEKIQMTKAWRQKFYEEQIDGIMFAINDEKESQGGKGFSVKQLEAKRKQLEAKLKKLTDKAKDEDGAMFEDLGVDSLFVDEAHNFKNLEYTTRMNNVSGLGKADGSQRAFDLYTKVRYLQQLNGGRGVVFATATPVMNSMTEMYIMQRYLQPDTLKHLGIDNFDSWAKMFGEVVNALEIAPSGSGYRLKQTFSKFKNIKALQQLFRSFTDVVTDIPGLKIPKMKGGKVQIVECEQGEFQKNYMEKLAKRAENVKNVDPSEDNMLKITSDGRKISYSQRMIDPSLPYEEGGKIYKCCDNVYSVYKESNNTNGTQMIFCDMATPKGKTISNTDSDTNTDEFSSVDTESAQLYDDIKARLIQLGIPANEIAFIHDAKNDKQKAALSEKMNKGKIRVLIGSTGKMGVGLNAQVKAVAIHHLDAPWRPGDIEQRDGRVFRQKNENQEAYKFVYVTKGSFDSRLWDILERKQKFINQIMNGDDVGNEAEDTGEVTLSAAEVKAVASGSPLIMEQVALEKEISKLESLLQAHTAGVNRAEQMIITDERRIASLEKRISDVSEDINNRKDTYSSDQVFSIKIGQQTFTDKKEAGTALVAAAQAKAKEGNYTAIGSFAGFTIRVVKTKEGISGIVSGAGSYEFKVYPLNPTYGINHLISVVESFEENLSRWNKNLSETRIDLETQKQLAAEPFAQSGKLKEKRARYNEVMYILNPPAELNLSDDMVQEQSREYLESYEPITKGMTDEERYEILKDRIISLDAKTNTNELRRIEEALGQSSENAELLSQTDRKKLFRKIGEEFGVFKEYENTDIRLTFEFSKNNMRESISKQKKNYSDFAKMLSCFDKVIDSAVGIEVHNRNGDGYKYDPTLKDTYVLVSAFEDADNIVPVKFEIKEFFDKKNSLYVAIALESIKRDEVVKQGNTETGVTQSSRSSVIRIADLFSKINPSDESFLKYAPKQFLTQSPVTQAISSAKTSIKQIPALFKDNNVHFEETNVDIGGGRFDLATEFLAEQGVKNYLFDPYNRPENVNMSTLNFLRSGNRADTATCANVLNVIAEPAARANVILEAAKSIKNDGTAYFMVYEGDGSGVGRETSSGWQNNRKTADYVGEIAQYFNSVVRKGKLIIAADPVSNLPKASWEISPGNAIQYQQRTNTLTDREVLQYAANEINTADLTDGEKDALRIFNARLTKLEQLQEQRTELGTLYKQQQFEPGSDRSKAAETLNRMHVLDEQIKTASEAVLSVEDKAVLKRVLQKARKVVEQQERAKGQEALRRWRDRRNNSAAIKKYRDRLRGDVDELTNWVLHPDNKNVVKHIPDALKNAVVPFLSSINFMSKQQLRGGNPTAADKALMEQARKLAKVMESAVNVDEMYSNYTDLPPDFMQNLRNFMDTAQAIVDNNSGDFIINQMTSDELKELSKVVRTLKKYIMDMNRFHVNAMFQHVYEAGDNSIEFLSQLKPAENTGSVSQFLLWQQMRPAYAFERFGEGGKAIYDGLRRGQATLAFNTKKIQEFTEKAYTTAEVTAWEKQVKTIRIAPGKVVTMRVSQIMSLYELNKREQARGHILGEGIRVATFKNGRNKISDVGQTLTPGELNLILRELTPRQKEVADKLQQFMQKQGGAWGNYVTVARFGEKQFGEENYFPINSDGRHLSVNADEKPGAAALYALLNMGFTKQTQEKAKNRIVVYSIFDVFANHMASMAQYNAFALPVVDALKWFNYQQVDVDEDGTKTILGSVREQMDRAFGVPEESRPGSGNRGYAQNFVINIIKAFNGTEAQGTPYDSFGMQALHHYNRAQIAYNFRVVVQQPLAITRAAMLLDYTSIIRGMKLAPSTIKKNIQEMQKYSGIAAWKSLGFYDVNISRGLTSIIKHDNTAIDKITDIGMWGAEKADTITWSAIWSACKEEVIRKQKLRPDSAGFYDAVTKLFEDVIYKTQVVDSVLTKNEFMRDKGFFARALGSFMSEATTTASMLVDAYDKYQMDLQRGMTRQQAWKKNRRMIVRTAYVFGIGAAILAAVQAVADALRDDDDYETFLEKWIEAFGGNVIDELMPFNKLPILSDFYDLAKEILSVFGVDTYGNPPQSVFMQWYDSLVNGVEIIYGKITGEEDRYTWYAGAYKLLQAASGIFGLPMATATREIITAWNNIVGSMAPSLKVKTYDSGAKNEIKYAYQDGYLTAEEAAEQLLQHGVVDTEDEAYWTIQGWEAGDGYSKYNAIYDAVRNGSSIDDAMDELTSHGYSEKDVLSQVKSQIGEWYKTGEITKQQAINMLTEYMDMDTDDITATVNKWSSVIVTGIAYEDIKDEYLAGNITEGRAIDMYVRYGGYSEEKAAETVTKWRSEKETGIAYDDLEESFMDGDITSDQLKSMYIEYGGMNDEEAAEKVTVLAFVKEHPETDGISYAAVDNYNTYCKSSGVSAEIFYDAWQYNSSTKADVDENGESISGSKKTKVLDYINTLDLTYDQKDALYYAFGWAESRIYEAPWH